MLKTSQQTDSGTVRSEYIIEKSNRFNEAIFSMQELDEDDVQAFDGLVSEIGFNELRFLLVYLSKIDARNLEQREATFALSDFVALLGIDKMNLKVVKRTCATLRKMFIYTADAHGFTMTNIFSQFKLTNNKTIHAVCTPEIQPFIFDLKEQYIAYKLENILHLQSVNQIRMYELLKQYQAAGTRTIPLKDLKRLLGIKADQYEKYNNFKVRVLDACQIALMTHTDIAFDFEPIRTGRTITAIKFTIVPNGKPKVVPLRVKEPKDEIEYTKYDALVEFICEACAYNEKKTCEFTRPQIEMLIDASRDKIWGNDPEYHHSYDLEMYHYIKTRYLDMSTRPDVKNRFRYLLKLCKSGEE